MDMTYRPLGTSGLMVSAVGVGPNAFSRRVDLGQESGEQALPEVGRLLDHLCRDALHPAR